MNVLFAVYIQLWVLSFEKTGIIGSKEEADAVYRNLVILAVGSTVVCLPLAGHVCDKVDLRYLIPFTFLARGIIAVSFRFLEDPSVWQSYFLCTAIVLASILLQISVEVLFMRNLKKSVRGALTGIAFFFGAIGTTTFSYVGGVLFDKVAPWAPFMVVAGADFAIIVFLIVFLLVL